MRTHPPLTRLARTQVAVAVLVAALAGTMLSATPSDATSSSVLHSYAASDAEIANPGRGMYHYTETHLSGAGAGSTPLQLEQLRGWRTQEKVTLVYRIFYLEAYRNVDTLDPADLARVATDLATARQAGVQLVVRFAYSATSSADAPVARVVGHVRQLAPVLNAAADVIASLQAGFVGQWGEWYYSDNFASDPARPWVLSPYDWDRRGTVLRELLAATSPEIPVQVRYPAVKQRLVSDPASVARVGIHDDCFLAGDDDYGTFAAATDRDWLAAQTRTAPMGGESCAVNAPRSQWASAAQELATYHWSFLNADFHSAVLDSWGPDGRAEARRRLGYRLRLVDATLPTAAPAGGPVPLQLRITNDGYAAPLAARPVELVLRSATDTRRVRLPLDVRTLQPGVTTTVDVQVNAPDTAGSYAMALAMPDAAAGLADRPEYAVQLADAGLWDAAHGWNDLQQTLVVTRGTVQPRVSLSSLTPMGASSGWGPYERDTSNGEAAAGDGHALSLRGQRFAQGLGVHSSSTLTYPLGGAYRVFTARVGIDDETAGRGTAVFQAWVDGTLRWTSPVTSGSSPAVPLSLPVAGARSLRLVVTDAGDGKAYDHADWADASLAP